MRRVSADGRHHRPVAYVVNDTAVALVGGIFLDGIAYSIVVELVGAEYYSCSVLAEVLEFIEAILLADASVGDFSSGFSTLGACVTGVSATCRGCDAGT